MVVRKGTCLILIAMIYSAVIVVMMKIVHIIDETIYQGWVEPDQHVEKFIFFSF